MFALNAVGVIYDADDQILIITYYADGTLPEWYNGSIIISGRII
jgi:hypothetical protein